MKVALFLFSGTGNTNKCGEFLKNHFLENQDDVDIYVHEIGKQCLLNPNDYDLIGFGYPIHAFNVPQTFIHFIRSLPQVDNKKYFIFKVSGEPFALNNASSHMMYSILKRKGYKLVGEKHFLMPYNIMFKYNDQLQKQMYLYLDPLTKVMVNNLSNDKQERIKYNPLLIFWSFLLRIEWLAPKINCLFLHNRKDKCTKCMICVNNCPQKAMYINKKGKIKTHSNCALCMRCSLNCPVAALHMGIFEPWAVHGGFHYQKLVEDTSNPGIYVNYNTKGYFKLFRKYFLKQNKLLKENNIPLPVVYNEENALENLEK